MPRAFNAATLGAAALVALAWLPATPQAKAAAPGEGRALYLPGPLLAEAESPSTSPASTGGALWNPGAERLCGWALRDLRDGLGRAGGDGLRFEPLDPDAPLGVFAGTFADHPGFAPLGAAARRAFASTDPEAFAVEAQGDRLYVLGRTRMGLIGAIYTLLDRLGFKWYAPGSVWESVPQRTVAGFGPSLDVASAGPSYRARFFFPSFGPNTDPAHKDARARDYALWGLRNRLGGSAYTANFHNDPALVPPDLFATRPELFALAGGKRNPYGLSRGNPETVALAVASAVKYLKENRGKGSYYDSFSVETNDGSPACEESLRKVGNHTATDLDYWFANQVAAGIEAAGLKDRWVGMCSYSDHAGVPSFDLHPRVGVVVTTGLDFSSGGLTVEQRLDGLLARGCRRLGVYEYLNLIMWSLDLPGCSPATDPKAVAANLKRWHERGAVSYVAETSDSWVGGGPGHYLAARLLWDATADPEAELAAYYAGAFGPAAAEVRALNEDWAALPLKVKQPPGAVGGPPRIPRERCAGWHAAITRAEALVQGDPVFLARLNALKRYHLYLNLTREYEIDLTDPRLPPKEERYLRLLRYVGANRGEGAFHALGLFSTLLAAAPQAGFDAKRWPKEFQTLATNLHDEAAWKAFPPLSPSQVDDLFRSAALPAEGHAGPGTFDPRLRVFPADAPSATALKFPKLHGPPAVPRRYLLRVQSPTARLTFDVAPGSPHGAGMPERTCVVTDGLGRTVQRFEFPADRPARFELTGLKPGVYTATFPEFGAEQLTVSGGALVGAVRAAADAWGFNPMRRADAPEGEPVKAYFVIPAGRSALSVKLNDGVIALGFEGGPSIAETLQGAAGAAPREFRFEPSDSPRVAYLKVVRATPSTAGLVVEGVTLYSPTPDAVLYETLD